MESIEDRRAVAKEILDQTLHYLHGVFGSDNPSKSRLIYWNLILVMSQGRKMQRKLLDCLPESIQHCSSMTRRMLWVNHHRLVDMDLVELKV